MLDGGELGGDRGAHPLGGRVGRDQLRVLGLQRLQLAHHRVVGAVVDGRLVEDVVAVVGVVDGIAQLGGALLGVHAAASPASTSAGDSNTSCGRSANSSWRAKMPPHMAAAAVVPAAWAARRSNGESPT